MFAAVNFTSRSQSRYNRGMSGHSKWSTIKRHKQTTDDARGQLFTKIANLITVAVREGGENVEANVRLRLAIERARAANIPKSNIERAIARARGRQTSGQLIEVLYEGFGPGGAAILAEGITDNKQRTAASVKHVFASHGVTLGGGGSSVYLFERVGSIYAHKNSLTLDQLLEYAIDCGGKDVEDEGDRYAIYTEPGDLKRVKDYLETKHGQISESELTYQPKTKVTISDRETATRLITLLKSLDELPDIHRVHTDADIPDDLLP